MPVSISLRRPPEPAQLSDACQTRSSAHSIEIGTLADTSTLHWQSYILHDSRDHQQHAPPRLLPNTRSKFEQNRPDRRYVDAIISLGHCCCFLSASIKSCLGKASRQSLLVAQCRKSPSRSTRSMGRYSHGALPT